MDPHALDPAWLRAQLPPHHSTQALIDHIANHLDSHDGYVSLSGGKDSLVVLHLALQADRSVPVCFFDSGLEFPETITYLAQLEEHFDIDITVIPASPSLLDVLHASGAWDHHRPTQPTTPDLHQILITHPADQAAALYGPGVLWGIRADESPGRRALLTRTASSHRPGATTSAAGTHCYSPIWNWTSHDVWNHIHRHHLPTNPVYAKLRHLGAPNVALRVSHLVDGGLLGHGRITWLKAGWPELWQPLVAALPRLADFT